MFTRERTQIVQLMLPWFDPAGELYYQPMALSEPGQVDRRKAFRIVRNWYKEQIGVQVCKTTLTRIWKRRFVTFAIDEESVNNYFQDMARETYEETETEGDSGAQEEACSPAGR